jgi:hypothetical protein
MGVDRPQAAIKHVRSAPEPAKDAAVLLRRLGFALLVLVMPVAAIFARRAVVILAPLGALLLILATLIESDGRQPFRALKGLLLTPSAAAVGFLGLWATASLLWSPFPEEAAERLARVLGTALLALTAAASLPPRMRASNLHLVPLGVGIGLVGVIAVMLLSPATAGMKDADGLVVERSVTSLLLLVWPAIGWLIIRDHRMPAIALAAATAVAVLITGSPLVLAAAFAGALAYGLTATSRVNGVRIVRAVIAGAILMAPLIPLLLLPLFKSTLGTLDPATQSVRIWANLVRDEPLRLITGHGLETALRGQLTGLLPLGAPRSFLFEIWYELGMLGAAASALALWLAVRASIRLGEAMTPCLVGAIASAFTLMCLGAGGAQVWWLTSVTVTAIAFTAVVRGQFKTTRPKARLTMPPAPGGGVTP